jgi:hypothetical protein
MHGIVTVEPAHVDQLRRARDGRMVLIDADVGGVVADLQKLDPSLRVRFAENGNPPFWAVYHEHERADGSVTHDLVLTAQAHQGKTGAWLGLDQRIVDRVKFIDGHAGYDYVKELEKQNKVADLDKKRAFREKAGVIGEEAAFALRKDRGVKRRIAVPRDIPA